MYRLAFSVRGFSFRVGISKEKLYRSLAGQRWLSPSELQAIAKGLGITVERVKQLDTEKRAAQLRRLVKNRKNPRWALEISLELLQLAVGYSERVDVLNDLGLAYYYLKRYREAHETWLQALAYAEKLKAKYDDKERLYMVISNLIISYTQLKEYTSLSQLLSRIEPAFAEVDPRQAGQIRYSQAIAAYNMGDLNKCREEMYEYLHYYRLSDDRMNMAIAMHNVGYIEFLHGDYEKSKEFYESAIAHFDEPSEYRFIAVKDYIKTLLKLRKREQAIKLLNETLNELETFDFHAIMAKLLLLKAMTLHDRKSAEAVLSLENTGQQWKLLSCHYLMEYSRLAGDDVGIAKYYKESLKYSHSPTLKWEEI